MSKKKDPVAQPDGVQHAAPEVPAAAPPPQEVAGGNGNGEAKNPPATVVRLGRVKVAVWTNYSRDGRPFYATTVRGSIAPRTGTARRRASTAATSWSSPRPSARPSSGSRCTRSPNGDDEIPF